MIKKLEKIMFLFFSWFLNYLIEQPYKMHIDDRRWKYSTCTGSYCNFKVKCSTKLLNLDYGDWVTEIYVTMKLDWLTRR